MKKKSWRLIAGQRVILYSILNAQSIKGKADKLDLIKIKDFCFVTYPENENTSYKLKVFKSHLLKKD